MSSKDASPLCYQLLPVTLTILKNIVPVVTIVMECSFSHAAAAPDTRTFSFILNALTGE